MRTAKIKREKNKFSIFRFSAFMDASSSTRQTVLVFGVPRVRHESVGEYRESFDSPFVLFYISHNRVTARRMNHF